MGYVEGGVFTVSIFQLLWGNLSSARKIRHKLLEPHLKDILTWSKKMSSLFSMSS